MNTVLMAVGMDDLSLEAQKKPNEDKESILKRMRNFLDTLQKIWALKGVSAARNFFMQ